MQHPVQWDICSLHINELPLRHYFSYFDGPTTGPKSFSGPLGLQIMKKEEINSMAIQNFKKIAGRALPKIDRQVLSKDQSYLFDIVNAVKTGYVSSSVATRKLGRVHNARFLNLASILLRLYISTKRPSEALKSLASFIVKVRYNLNMTQI